MTHTDMTESPTVYHDAHPRIQDQHDLNIPPPRQTRFFFLKMSTIYDPATIASTAKLYGLLPAQTAHRINLLSHSHLDTARHILELGCGQGDCTTMLALLYPSAHITAVDPGPRDYGNPETLGQAHDRIKGYDIGKRVTFHQAAPIEFLSNAGEGEYDVAVLCHCLWYFSSTAQVKDTFTALRSKVKKLFIAEWSLSSHAPSSHAHVLAALTRAACEAHIPHSMENIRTPVAPAAIKTLAAEVGWVLEDETIVEPADGLEDAHWEAGMLIRADPTTGENCFLERARREVREEKVVTLLESMVDAVKGEVERAGGASKLTCMDAWVGIFS